jgi:hypothetical protein
MEFFTAQKAEQILKKWLQTVADNIVKNANEKDKNLQNKIPKSLVSEVVHSGNSTLNGRLYGWKWIVQAWETGRGATKNTTAGRPTLAEKLEKWVVLRGIETRSRSKIKSAAYAIARSIHRKGTKQWQTGQATGIITDAITENDLNMLKNSYISSVKNEITALLKARNDNSSSNT